MDGRDEAVPDNASDALDSRDHQGENDLIPGHAFVHGVCVHHRHPFGPRVLGFLDKNWCLFAVFCLSLNGIVMFSQLMVISNFSSFACHMTTGERLEMQMMTGSGYWLSPFLVNTICLGLSRAHWGDLETGICHSTFLPDLL